MAVIGASRARADQLPAAFLIGLALFASTAAPHGTTVWFTPTNVSATSHCPAKPPTHSQLRRSAHAGSNRYLVPGVVRDALVCAYAGLNSGEPGQLASQGEAGRDASRLLQQRLNRGQIPTGRIYHCPLDDGSSYLVEFGYPQGTPQQVAISRTGCRFATNGKRYVFASANAEDQLATITDS